MLLANKHIREAIDSGVWIARRDGRRVLSNEMTIGSNSINVSLDDHILDVQPNRVEGHDYIDLHVQSSIECTKTRSETFYFEERDFALMNTREQVDCRKPLIIDGKEIYFTPMIETRSTLARCGVSTHLSAGFGDLGFSSVWVLEVTTERPIILRHRDEVGQIYFEGSTDGSVWYGGAYVNQGLQPPVLGKDRFQRF